MKRMPFNRRLFLRSAAGLCIGLPLLEATHGHLMAAEGKAKRFVLFFSHGGTISCRHNSGQKGDPWAEGTWHNYDLWAPGDEGEQLSVLGEEMAPLEPVKGDLLLLRGVDDMAGSVQGDYGGHHGCSNATVLTCADTTEGGDYADALGPSIDQVIAQRLASEAPTPFASMDVMVDGHNYGEPVYSASNQRLSTEKDPRAAFERLFQDVTESTTGPTPEQLRIRAYKKSVLDGVTDHLTRMKSKVSSSDAHLLDAHAEHIRSLENQLEQLENIAACTKPDVSGAPESQGYGHYEGGSHDLVARAFTDIIVHGFRCGLSNVATMQIGDILCDWQEQPYLTDLGHSLGHAGLAVGPAGAESDRLEDWRATILANRNWRMEMFGRIVDGLKQTPEGDGTMLDNSILLFTSEFGIGGAHSPRDVPCLLAGRAGGRWTTGRHINYNKKAKTDPTQSDYETDASMHNVYTSILHAFGWDDAHFGNGTSYRQGALAELG